MRITDTEPRSSMNITKVVHVYQVLYIKPNNGFIQA